ncbi:hypothetical protein NIES4071_70730 [Calothrix sp. NIES-4071]|nr:hypothetical protein NIES4071_70730 [Calothrix sp. NIES-4071]BAZ61348.1 hypothetical protein NIES4105_70680 [Calothrix sp. NIES-4105]
MFLSKASGLKFILVLWFCSRIFIVIAMQLIAPSISKGEHIATWGWDAFARWDGVWYQQIATSGYEFVNDGRLHSVPFFPLYPTITWAVMKLGLPFGFAGTLVNNLAFLGALITIYHWVSERHNIKAARWTVAALTWCPLSLYGTVTYTEGLFLLLSSLSLRAFDKNKYVGAAFWGALTTATRLTGITLIPTYLFLAWQEKRGIKAYVTAGVSSIGFLLYSAYCAVKFGDPLAFLTAQAAFGHRSAAGVDLRGWGLNFIRGAFGSINWSNYTLKNPFHLVQFVLICVGVYLLWRRHQQLNKVVSACIGFILLTWMWLLWGDGFVKTYMVFGGSYLLWHLLPELRPVVLTYCIFSLLLVFFSGSIVATERFAYGIVSIAIAFGILLSRHSRWGLPTLIYFAIVLASFAIRFSRNIWVA